MTETSHAHSKRRLDALLAELPTPGGEPTDAHFAARFERTLRLITADQSTRRTGATDDTDPADAAGDAEDAMVLRTPLPLEAGEPDPADPFSFEPEVSAYCDPLRAPLKSGEHAPVRLDAVPDPATFVASESASAHTDDFAPRADTRAPVWAYWLSGGIGVLAAAAAVVVAMRSPPPINVGQNSEGRAVATPVVAQVANEPTSLEPPAAEVAEQAKPAEAAVAMPQAVSRPSLGRAKASPAVAKPASGNPETQLDKHEKETLVPAAGPSNLTERPSVGALNAALADAIPIAQRCLTPDSPEASVRIVFQSNGSVQNVQAAAPRLSSEASACLRQAFARAHVDPFAKAQAEVTRTISLPKR